MGTWNSRGLRGSLFEEMINNTNEIYKDNNLALVQKIPTPITPIKIDSNTKQITLAYFDSKSTVDYIGVVQGVPICFDAKECDKDTFSIANIHKHQIDFMKEYKKQDGMAFFLIYYSQIEMYYYLRLEEIIRFYERSLNGGRKSFRRDELDERFFFSRKGNLIVPYLDMLKLDLELLEN